MAEKTHPVLFIHGLWLHPTSWAAWSDLFARHGYHTTAPGWPDEPATVDAARSNPDALAGKGIEEIVEHYRSIIEALDDPPIIVGHSFGGLFAEKLLGEGRAAAAVAIDAAQIKGVLRTPLSALRATLPVFKNPANRHRTVSLTAEQFRYSFGNAVTKEESDELFDRWAVPGPARPLFEAATANFSPHAASKVDTDNDERGPLLLVMGGEDHTVPESVTKATAQQYKHSAAVTDTMEFADRGHSLTIDSGWQEVAEASLTWLEKQGL
ncbi:MAG: alpha/beta hydrolase [Actinobacteria bacterium]|nr:alpha/beta hydrolase [Actinomycetota bacterium]MBV9254402.1 alpha/beta hydrolase [Actinomycetota bacterium]MBV9665718.1 alpha/beta hydrolase [Actinomycetota bacterium]MBV9934219.1 alpha/beta hydrolase [Actinomycetota bacterium]